MLVVGLTGGIGSGKSTVSERFAQHGVPIIDTDLIARKIVAPGLPAHREIIAKFGNEVIDTEGRLNRSKMREIVFSSELKRLQLEEILHPRIFEQMQKQLAALRSKYCIVVVPLLAESKRAYPFDRTLVVDSTVELQIERAANRDDQVVDDIEKIIDAQVSRDERLSIADDVIDNSGSLRDLNRQIDDLHRKYLRLSRNHDE